MARYDQDGNLIGPGGGGVSGSPAASSLVPMPGSGNGGAMYDPQTGTIYEPDGTQAGHYDPTTGIITDPNGQQFTWDPTKGVKLANGAPGGLLTPVPSTTTTTGGGATTPPPTSGGPQTSPDIYNSPLTKPFGETFTAPAPIDLGGPAGLSFIPKTPTFTGASAPPTFTAPSVAEALNEPGFQFQLQQGDQGIQNWAAARGTLNDSGTAKALSDYNRSAAQSDYANVFNRDLGVYQGVTLPNWMATVYNPTMTAYGVQATAGQGQNTLNYQNAWNAFLNNENQYNNWQDRVFGKLFQTATA